MLEAEQALELVQVRPEQARSLADRALRRAHSAHDWEAIAVAERVLGLAASDLGDIPGAAAHLRRAIAAGAAAGLPTSAARARMSLSRVLAYAGESEEALRQLDLAATVLRGGEAGPLRTQRGLILQRLGRLEEALSEYRLALRLMRRAGDTEGEAKVLMNRGVLRAYRGEWRGAHSDLVGAERRYLYLGHTLYAAKVRHNLGFVAARRGDFPAALRCYEAAEGEYERAGVPAAVALLDRGETLLAVRLVVDARQVLERAARQLEAGGMEADLAEARLLLAQACLLAGEATEAKRLATLARRAFRRQGRAGWSALAGYALVRAAWMSGERSEQARLAAERACEELTEGAWAGPALDAHLIAARIALSRGESTEAETHLRRASQSRRSGPADLRARAWHAVALLRHAHGDWRGTESALRAGVRVLARQRATLGATELRVHAAANAEELAQLGVRTALESGRADRVLAWVERCRAGALLSRPARPPGDAELADELADLRNVVGRVEAAGFTSEDPRPLLRRQADLEERIRRRSWQASGDSEARALAPPSVGELAAALGDTALVELLESEGQLHAVCIVGRRATFHPLTGAEEVAAEVHALRFALGRLARRRGSAASRQAAVDALHHAADQLDEALFAPLSKETGDRPLVVVPTGALHALPWSVLPSCRGRPVSVCPSAALWLRAAVRPPGGDTGRTVLVAGPNLAHAEAEVSELARVYPHGEMLFGARATTADVTRAADGAALLHVAAHGTFRADNPLFSSLQLSDGPLMVYDLEALPRAPRCVTLSACDAGLSAVRPGAELMGLSAALLCLGSDVLIASVVGVPDDVTRALMVGIHERLAAGASAAEALADVQASAGRDGGEALACTAGFVCFGAGGPPWRLQPHLDDGSSR
ncbi:MAG: CHAT domain-containing protein [Actinomycetota bacterium]|nr:CHAT domain-containing protein [Actinomycetota bacterium]